MLYFSTRIYAMGCTMFLHADTKHLTLPGQCNEKEHVGYSKGLEGVFCEEIIESADQERAIARAVGRKR